MTIYYNEFDPFAAAMLRNLITAGHIAPGVVDTRSIEDVRPSDLAGFTQCHFFAGVGVWSHALRRAGWADDRPVWTGSCPCQPFSAAGQGAGFADERHLWPAFHHLIKERKPECILGEQVASKDSDPWIDLVHTDLEALGYAFGAVPFPSAGVGAPHIRDRLYWVADAANKRLDGRRAGKTGNGRNAARIEPQRLCVTGGLADADNNGFSQSTGAEFHDAEHNVEPCGSVRGVANADGSRPSSNEGAQSGVFEGAHIAVSGGSDAVRTSQTNGFWIDADWLGCRDGKWRPVEPGSFPLVDGAPSRVGRLRAYGNAVNAEAALAWIVAVMESRH